MFGRAESGNQLVRFDVELPVSVPDTSSSSKQALIREYSQIKACFSCARRDSNP